MRLWFYDASKWTKKRIPHCSCVTAAYVRVGDCGHLSATRMIKDQGRRRDERDKDPSE
jgi:hypothetical protein